MREHEHRSADYNGRISVSNVFCDVFQLTFQVVLQMCFSYRGPCIILGKFAVLD